MKLFTRSSGFTLIELMVVIAILGILASLSVPKVGMILSNARDARRKSDLIKLRNALTVYLARTGGYPSSGGAYIGSQAGDPGIAIQDPTNYIPALVPDFANSLPQDPIGGRGFPDPNCSGVNAMRAYAYRSDGVNYKLISHCAPERVPLSDKDTFYDPVRPTFAWMVCSGAPACKTW